MLDVVVELVEGSQAGALLAHPLTQHPHFPLSPLVTAVLAAVAVVATALLWPGPGEEGADLAGDHGAPLESWAGSLTLSQVVARVVSVILLGLALAAGRGGIDDELENLAPALVIGVAWPGLVLATVSLGPVWRWLDPWDASARLLIRDVGHSSSSAVWPALLPAFAWVWYLSAYPTPLNPRSVGAILALYTLVTIAGCLALGRARWLQTSEPLGIMLTWMARLRRGVLSSWRPPWGAEALQGVLIGGVLFGAARRSGLWGALNTVPQAQLLAAAGVAASSALVAGALLTVSRGWQPSSERDPIVARVTAPVLASVIAAVALDLNRLFTSLQLLPKLVTDPFGRGWDPLGWANTTIEPDPLGDIGLVVAQLVIILAGHLAGAVVLARESAPNRRGRAALLLSGLAAVSVIAVVTD